MGKGQGVSGRTHSREQLDHYANQHNPNHDAYRADRDNHANQCNPNNDAYSRSREDARQDGGAGRKG